MESSGREDERGSIPYGSCDLGIADFMDNQTNLDQYYIDHDLIWEEDNSILNFISTCEEQNHGGSLPNSHLFSPVDHLFDFNDVATNHVARTSPDCSTFNDFPNNEEETDEEVSSTKKKKKKKKKSDRSITLISERRRRSRMKEKLYALRSLVPTITKMDKASIIGDAVLYVQDLQMQAKKLRSEIAGLDSSITKGINNHNHNNNKKKKFKSKKINAATSTSYPTIENILKMDIVEVEERGFYARIVSKKEKGVAVLLYKALHSLTTLVVQTSNLATLSHDYVFTFTLHTAEDVDLSLPGLKMWVTRAFLDQGFDFEI